MGFEEVIRAKIFGIASLQFPSLAHVCQTMNGVIRHGESIFCVNKFEALVTLPEEILYIEADDKRGKINFNCDTV